VANDLASNYRMTYLIKMIRHDSARKVGMCTPVDYFIQARFWILFTSLSLIAFICGSLVMVI